MNCQVAFAYPQHAHRIGWAALEVARAESGLPTSMSAAAKQRFLAHFRVNPGQLACHMVIAQSPALKREISTDATLRPLLRHGLASFLEWVASPSGAAAFRSWDKPSKGLAV